MIGVNSVLLSVALGHTLDSGGFTTAAMYASFMAQKPIIHTNTVVSLHNMDVHERYKYVKSFGNIHCWN